MNFLTSGIGQYHTNEPGKENRKPYLAIGVDAIKAMVDNPQQCDKAQAQWLITSSLPSRNFKEQGQRGEFWMIWADLDKNPPSLPELYPIVEGILGGCDFELYNSRSATADNQKCRALILLDKPLFFADWNLAQGILNDKLEALGIIPDRAAERAAQLCYLPNRGAFYGSLSKRDGKLFNPLQHWQAEINHKREKLEAERVALEAAKQKAIAKRAELKLSDTHDLIGAFNLVYTPQDWMIKAGYAQKGDSFRHPNSETGNYSASVKADDNGLLRVNTLSSNDPLFNKCAGAHDAFSTFCTLFHGDDRTAALKDAGDNLLTIGFVSWNKAIQREYAKNTTQPQQAEHPSHWGAEEPPSYGESIQGNTPGKSKFSLCSFSLSGQSKAMELKMLEDKYVLDKLAILGQATAIYAKPNTGKTLLVLWLLIQSINNKEIKAESVFYINADDDYKGLVFKTRLAEQYGFEMLAPGHNGFESAALMGYMRQMIDDDTANGVVIILDTLKKFTDLMNKKTGSEFMSRAREFVASGGTLIMLAHTNKNKDVNGKVVFGGTSDIVDDCDCVFMLDEIEKHPQPSAFCLRTLRAVVLWLMNWLSVIRLRKAGTINTDLILCKWLIRKALIGRKKIKRPWISW